MINRKNFNTSKVTRLMEAYAQAVIAGQYIFLSGMPGINPISGKVGSDNFEEQTRQCFLNVKTILDEAGSGMTKIVKTTIFMVAGNDFAIINKCMVNFFRKMRRHEVYRR